MPKEEQAPPVKQEAPQPAPMPHLTYLVVERVKSYKEEDERLRQYNKRRDEENNVKVAAIADELNRLMELDGYNLSPVMRVAVKRNGHRYDIGVVIGERLVHVSTAKACVTHSGLPGIDYEYDTTFKFRRTTTKFYSEAKQVIQIVVDQIADIASNYC